MGITSRRTHDVHDTELLIEERDPEFDETGLVKTSVVRCEYVMTIPGDMIVRKLGCFSLRLMAATDDKLRLSLGL